MTVFWLAWVRQWLAGASIRKKILVGYAMSISIAILGTTIGLGIGEHYQRKAIEQSSLTNRQQHLLAGLQREIGQVRLHALRFVYVLDNPVSLGYEKDGFFESIDTAKQLHAQAKSFLEKSGNQNRVKTDLQSQELLASYIETLDAYEALIKSLLPKINPSPWQLEEIEAAQELLLRKNDGKIAKDLYKVDQLLAKQSDLANDQEYYFTKKIQSADQLRERIIFISILLSLISAASLAAYTSRLLVEPIRKVTEIAQQVTEESNFKLRVPVTSRDEVGVLATSLNQLIARIDAYTKERKQAEARLIHTEKMSSLGSMVAGVAHEINNPVNFIYGNLEHVGDYINDLLLLLQLYQQQYPEPDSVIQNQLELTELDFLAEDLPKILSSMREGADRIREIVLSLRNFSRLNEAEIKSVNLHEGLDNTLTLLGNRLTGKIEVFKQYGDLPLVECYPAHLNQVFLSLFCNAIDAIEEAQAKQRKVLSPCITICTDIQEVGSKKNTPEVIIRITDNGCGISTAIQERIFDPFFTTKDPGKGTGLGLAISYQVIAQHQGTIQVKSVLGQGTEVAIILPVHLPHQPAVLLEDLNPVTARVLASKPQLTSIPVPN